MLKNGKKYSVLLNGGSHIIEVLSHKGTVKIYGDMFPEPIIGVVSNIGMISNGSLIGVTMASNGAVKLAPNYIEEFKPGNAYTFSISAIKEIGGEI